MDISDCLRNLKCFILTVFLEEKKKLPNVRIRCAALHTVFVKLVSHIQCKFSDTFSLFLVILLRTIIGRYISQVLDEIWCRILSKIYILVYNKLEIIFSIFWWMEIYTFFLNWNFSPFYKFTIKHCSIFILPESFSRLGIFRHLPTSSDKITQ